MSRGRDNIQRPEQRQSPGQPSPSIVFQQNQLNLIQHTALDPDTLDRLVQIKPEYADALVETWQGQVRHRQKMEEWPFRLRSRGQIFGFIGALVMMGAGIYLIAQGKITEGTVLIGAPTLGIAGAFYYERLGHSQQGDPPKKKP